MTDLSDFGEHVKTLLDQILSDDLEDLGGLDELSRNVKWEVFRVDDTLHEVEVLGDEVVAVIHDEDSSNVELDVVLFLLRLKEVEGGTILY